ncbi:hypothetical protein BJ742DRAFT_872840 [Cladochytrium replicatum]|nr:hypothetical protein BJ742DRAFT_872840 [Cladochytrium replicatum]
MPAFSKESALNVTSLTLNVLTLVGAVGFIAAGMLVSRAPYLEYIVDITKNIPTSVQMLLSTSSVYSMSSDFNRAIIEASDLGWWLIAAGNVMLVSTFPGFLAVSTRIRRRPGVQSQNFAPIVDADAETEQPASSFVNPARKRRYIEFFLVCIAVDLFVASAASGYALFRVSGNRAQLATVTAAQVDVVPQLELLMMQIDNQCCGYTQGVISDGTSAMGDVLGIMQETFAGNANITDEMAESIEERFLGTSLNPCETAEKVSKMPACYEMVKSSVDMQFISFIALLGATGLILIGSLITNIFLYRHLKALPTEESGVNGHSLTKLEQDFEHMKEPTDYPTPVSKKVIRTTTASQPPVYEAEASK